MLRIPRERLHPTAQLRLMHTEIERGLRIRDAPLLDQPNRLKLELPCKLPSLHDTPPVPSKHLTRCLRNRVQAIRPSQRIYGRQLIQWKPETVLAGSSLLFAQANRCDFEIEPCQRPVAFNRATRLSCFGDHSAGFFDMVRYCAEKIIAGRHVSGLARLRILTRCPALSF